MNYARTFFADMAEALKPVRMYDPTPIEPITALVNRLPRLVRLDEITRCDVCKDGQDIVSVYIAPGSISSIRDAGGGESTVRTVGGDTLQVRGDPDKVAQLIDGA